MKWLFPRKDKGAEPWGPTHRDSRPQVRLDEHHWWPFDSLVISVVDGELKIEIDGRDPQDGPGFIPTEVVKDRVEIVSEAGWGKLVGDYRLNALAEQRRR